MASVPTADEIKHVFQDISESIEQQEFDASNFRRLNENSDEIFYSTPRFVEHIDKSAVKSLISFHSSELEDISYKMYGVNQYPLAILDLCSSWVSHLPAWYTEFPTGESSYEDIKTDQLKVRRTVGLGMNKEELEKNGALTENVVLNLNNKNNEEKSIVLPFSSESFDVVLLQLSIDYLTAPIEVMKEVSRVLRPGGEVIIRFYCTKILFLHKLLLLFYPITVLVTEYSLRKPLQFGLERRI
jgi:hypothetical protein